VGAIDDLAAELSKLPGIGRKTALRLTYHLLKQTPDQSKRLATALMTLAEVICAVEEASDIGAIERSGEFRGVYHVLGGRLSPLDGIGPEDLTIPQLETRVSAGVVREVIIATNPSIEGETTALYVQRRLARYPLTVSRIARGLPVGGDLEYADGVTIAQALTARRAMT